MATLLLIQTRPEQACEEARQVLAILEQKETLDFWAMASRGEAELLLGEDVPAALQHYRHAINERDCRPMDRKSMRDQILFLRPHLSVAVRDQLTDEVLAELFQLAPEAKL